MKKNQLFLGLATIAAAVFSFSSCSQDELSTSAVPAKGQEIRLMTEMSTTRSVSQTIQDNAIVNGAKIGVFVANTGKTASAEFLTNGNNNAFTSDGNGGLSVTSGSEIYFPTDATKKVDIYGYAPYQSDWDNTTELTTAKTFTVQTDQSTEANYLASDLLYATPLTNQGSAETGEDAYKLKFKHKLSKINVNITNNRTDLSLENARVYIRNTKPSVPITLGPVTENEETVYGKLEDATGDKTVILAAKLTSDNINTTDNEKPTATASAIVVPQTVPIGNFVKIVTDASKNDGVSTSLYAYLSSASLLESGHVYNFDVTIEASSVELTLTTSLDGWDDGSLSAGNGVQYRVGDYVLNDGTLIRSDDSNFESKKSNIVAVIFSTSVSDTDEVAGYDGYAMGVATLGGKTWGGESSWSGSFGTSITTWAAALTDLDGRSKTAEILSHDTYNSFTDENKAKVLANLSDYTLAIDAGAIVGSEADGKKNLSGWFTPSIGQMIQILNNLGNAGLDSNTGYANNNTGSPGWGYKDDDSSKPQGTNVPTTDVLIAVQTKINTYVTTAGQTAFGNNIYATVTQSGDNFWQVSFQSNTGYNIGRNAAKVPSNSSTRTVIPCLAYKIQ